MPYRRPAAALVLAGLCAALSGCVPQGLAFRTDTRLTFVQPEERATVPLPVKIDWDIRDFEVVEPGARGSAEDGSRDRGYFAVFVDSAPMPPNKPLRWIARKDSSCREADGCPDAEYLAGRGVYTTTETELVLEQLPRIGNDDKRRERHRAVVVLLDPDGRRIGESAFEIAFDIERSSTS